jgi:signal transduction histidine kinase
MEVLLFDARPGDARVSVSKLPSTLGRAVSFAHRRYVVSFVGFAGILATWGVMLGFSLSTKLGIVTLAPWVALIGFDAGVSVGLVGAVLAAVLWMTAANADDANLSTAQIVVRTVSLVVLGVGTAVAGRRLRASEEAHRGVAALQSSLIDSTLDGICLTDADGNILIANRTMGRLVRELGLPAEGTVLERLLAIADGITEPERYRERMRAIADEPKAASTDEFEVAETGRVFRGFTAPVPPASGVRSGRIWTLREVTADRELDRMRDAFVATVSHELRTPLTSISGFLELMQDEEESLGAPGRKYLGVIRRSTARLHALVEDLLLVAQIEARRIELELAPVDVVAVATQAVESVRAAATEKGVTVDVVADHPPAILADGHRLGQVLDNLVSNAVKFTREGGTGTVTVEADGGGVRLTVADTGIGIPLDEQGEVFSRFFRASTATRQAIPGTGLGLAISRALVEQHGGSIALHSREGEGTSVTVTLPAPSGA